MSHPVIPGGQRNPVTKRALCVTCLRDTTVKVLGNPITYKHVGPKR